MYDMICFQEMPWIFTALLLLTLTETIICDDRILSAYERRFNEMQKKSNTGYPVTRNGRMKVLSFAQMLFYKNSLKVMNS